MLTDDVTAEEPWLGVSSFGSLRMQQGFRVLRLRDLGLGFRDLGLRV